MSGHAAEHFVCYDLARRGLSAVSNPFEGGPYDIIADLRGELIRIQVKSTAEAYVAERVSGNKKWSVNAYQFHVKKTQLIHSDIVAFVAMDIEKIIYRTPAQLIKNTTGIEFSPAIMSLGCDKSLTKLLLNL
jgi:Holliday junction resolvase-like predicted endonuclease